MTGQGDLDRGWLIDQFRAELLARDLMLPGEIEEVGVFGDLLWLPCGDRAYVDARLSTDPAFVITGYSRWVALARIVDEIRFYAGAIAAGGPSWWWTGEDPARVKAVEAEPEEVEMAIFDSVADAVMFTSRYLAGIPLGDIDVPRIRPTPERYR